MRSQPVIARFGGLLFATVVLAAGTPLRAADPGAPAVGTYQDGRISITLQVDNPLDDTYRGTITSGGKTYPLTAHAREGKLEGSFADASGNSFPFSATLEAGNLTFTTSRSTYHLTPKPANPLDDPAAPPAAPAAPPAARPASGGASNAGVGMNIRITDDGSILVSGLNPDGPAAHAGVKVGDQLLAIDDQPLQGVQDLAKRLPGADQSTIKLKFRRGSETPEFTMLRVVLVPGRAPGAAPAAQGPPQTAPATGQPLRFRQLEVQDDPNMVGGTAFTLLIPEGWKSEGGIVWQNNIVEPCVVRMRIWDPASHSEVAAYPNIRFWWDSKRGPYSPPQGQVNFGLGLGAVTEPPADAPTALRQYVLPAYFKDLPADYRIISCEEDPDYAKYAQTRPVVSDLGLKPPTFTAAKALLEYKDNGKTIEQKVYCAVTTQSAGTLTYWSPCIISSVKAEKGQLDNVVAMLTCIGRSVTLNEDWAIKAYMLRQAAVKHRIEWLNRVTTSMDQFCNAQRANLTRQFQENMAASRAQYEKNAAAMDQQTESFNKILTGVQNYSNPVTGRTMELPSNSQPVYFNSANNAVQIGGDKPRDWTLLQPK